MSNKNLKTGLIGALLIIVIALSVPFAYGALSIYQGSRIMNTALSCTISPSQTSNLARDGAWSSGTYCSEEGQYYASVNCHGSGTNQYNCNQLTSTTCTYDSGNTQNTRIYGDAYAVDWDTSTYCISDCYNSGIWTTANPGWAIGGEVSAAACCGDDAAEFKQTCVDSSANGNCGADTESCCDANNKCIDDNGGCQSSGSCYDFGSSIKSYCNAGTWEDPDEAQSYCEAAGCGYVWIPLTSNCCGDDTDYETDEDCYQDIGLKVYDGLGTVKIAVEMNLNSPLRIAKSGITYGVGLVDVGHPSASNLKVQTSSGIKAVRKLP